jgi:hypothetical protein
MSLTRWLQKPGLESLNKWNWWLAGLYAGQAVIILLLSQTRNFGISTSFLNVDAVQSTTTGNLVLAPATEHLFDLNLAYLVAAFLLIAAVMHLLAASLVREQYDAWLKNRQSPLRWIDFSFSASFMLVAMAVAVGMYDAVSLLLVFGLGWAMHMIFMALEPAGPPKGKAASSQWLGYGVAIVAGCLPLLAILLYLLFANVNGTGHLPGFVYPMIISVLVLCGGLAGNLFLYLRQTGPWKQYLFTERNFIVLGLVVKSALAWQLFFGVLKP